MEGSSAAALQRLLDKDEIIDLVHRYSYCVDHRLYDDVVELFTEDCVVDYGPAFLLRILGPGFGGCSPIQRRDLLPRATTMRMSW